MNVGAVEAVKIGITRSFRNWRLWILFYVFNLLFAAVLAFPIATIFAKDVSGSLSGARLLDGFSYRWYVEFVGSNGKFFADLLPQMIFVFVTYIVAEIFFAAGFYSTFSRESRERVGTGEFARKGMACFFPLLAITIMEVSTLFLLYMINGAWASADKHAAQLVLSDSVVLRAELWRYGVVVFVFVVINLISDFIRAAVVIDEDSFLVKVRNGIAFAVKHPLSALGVYLYCTLISAAVIVFYYFFNFQNQATTRGGVLVEIVVSQLVILLRIFSKLIFYAGEAVLYKENQIEVIRVKPEMLE